MDVISTPCSWTTFANGVSQLGIQGGFHFTQILCSCNIVNKVYRQCYVIIMSSHRAKWNWHFNECPEATFPMLLMSVGYHTNVGTDCSCQDKCQPRSPCPSPSLWLWVYYTRLWKSLTSHRFLSTGTFWVLGKVWFPERKAMVSVRWVVWTWCLTSSCRFEYPTAAKKLFSFLLTIYLTIQRKRACGAILVHLSVWLFKADDDLYLGSCICLWQLWWMSCVSCLPLCVYLCMLSYEQLSLCRNVSLAVSGLHSTCAVSC